MKNSQFFDSILINDISVVSGVRHKGITVDNRHNGRKWHGFFYVYSGAATFYADGKEYVVLAGDLLYIPQNKRYKMAYTAESTVFVVVNFVLRDPNGSDAFFFDNISLVFKDQNNSLAQIMTNFELCSTSQNIGSLLRQKELMYCLLGLIYKGETHLTKDGTVDSRISRGVSLLEQTYLENLPIEQYAKTSNVSVNTFRRIFGKRFGMSPIKYRNLMRMDRARALLYEGSFTVAEVTYAVGFENVGYFCRYYRQTFGETPTETKRNNQ